MVNDIKKMSLREIEKKVKHEKVVNYLITWLLKNKHLFKDFE